ncbi:hypothetical protein HYFRA_00009884 [Hymenoscyphus fraxineus]|uniref:Uncharacterized protein n=1 Tax=Hymenoscyphus fraxineus TaxID=746836 RepID=A0A9N9PYD2_9HELO|nr:hypothetical protein HYFRA_00009884 [Hymenoscyphus fraxineus]
MDSATPLLGDEEYKRKPANVYLGKTSRHSRRYLSNSHSSYLLLSSKLRAMGTLRVDPSGLFTFPDADLPIVVKHGGERVVGKVSSTAMCLASPVWKKFIKPPFGRLGPARTETVGIESFKAAALGNQGSQATAGPQLDFQDDDSEALLLLLRIAHFQFVAIPSTLPYKTLLSMAVLVDQYDCVELVHPWVRLWLANESWESLQPDQENWLFIAWVFGRVPVFQNLADELARRTYLWDRSKFLKSTMPPLIIGTSSWKFREVALTDEMLESIFSTRRKEISKILEVPYRLADKLESTKLSTNRFVMSPTGQGFKAKLAPECKHNVLDCDILTYGSVTLHLLELQLWPKKSADEVLFSVGALATILRQITISQLPDTYNTFGSPLSHKNCPPVNIEQEIDNILSTKVPSPVLDSHILHMTAQHKRLTQFHVPR